MQPVSSHTVQTFKVSKNTYRPDIDGLRAIAVLLVIIFHINPKWIPGGFVGVDVFFVISGYLITKIILKELQDTGRISFRNFYTRRIRRLFPTLFVVVIFTSIIWFATQPIDAFRSAINESVFALASISNITFWLQSGYFDAESSLKPLLHTWSLSVEEQFYLFWPFFMVLLFKIRGYKAVLFGVSILATISFALNYLYFHMGKPDDVFFLTPFRVFEFAIGAAVILAEKYSTKAVLKELLLSAGIALILFASFSFNDDTVFPGINALYPCLGAALIIYAGQANFVGLLIRNPLAVWVGKASYSAYLVHWPLILYFNASPSGLSARKEFLLIILITFTLALILYFLVEQPFRSQKNPRAIFSHIPVACHVFLALIFITGAYFISSQGLLAQNTRYDLAAIKKQGEQYTWKNIRKLNNDWPTNIKEPKLLVIGDSQAADFINLLLAYNPSLEPQIRSFPSNRNCQIKMSENFYSSGDYKDRYKVPNDQIEKCNNDIEIYTQDTRLANADIIILSYAWYISASKYIDDEIKFLRSQNPSAPIYLVGRKDQPLSSINYLDKGFDTEEAMRDAKTNMLTEVVTVNDQISKVNGTQYINLYQVLCGAKTCEMFNDTAYPVLFDTRHFTQIGAKFISRGLQFYEAIVQPLNLYKVAT